jgi:hypothetical protein
MDVHKVVFNSAGFVSLTYLYLKGRLMAMEKLPLRVEPPGSGKFQKFGLYGRMPKDEASLLGARVDISPVSL